MKIPYKDTWYQSPLDLPEAESGKVRIQHRIIPAGSEVTIVGTRQALLRGKRPVVGTTQEPLRIHQLVHEDHGTWMTDLPEELNQISELIHNIQPHGRVLVGGLGLGIVAQTVADRTTVDQVTVVEIDPDIIRLCVKGRRNMRVAQYDIKNYLRHSDHYFEYYLLDTWQGTSENTWWTQVMPLRRIIRHRWGAKPVVHCWAEDIMHGQLFYSLTTKQPHWYYEHLPVPMSEKDAKAFLRNVGLPAWERKYGEAMDRTIK